MDPTQNTNNDNPTDPSTPSESPSSDMPRITPDSTPAPVDNSTSAPEPSPTITPMQPTVNSDPSTSGPVVSGDFSPPVAPGTPTPPSPFEPNANGGVVTSDHRKRWLKPLLAVIAVVVILGGGSAAAYFGIVVPNEPDNVLKTAITNTLKQKNFDYTGNINLDPASADNGPAAKITMSGGDSLVDKEGQSTIAVTVDGVTANLQIKYVNQNLYFNFGDLNNLSSLVTTIEPDLGGFASTVSGQFSNKWIEVDSTLLKQAGLSCVIDNDNSLNNDDIKQLEKDYMMNQFVAIKSSASDTVSNQSSEKYVLNVNDNKFVNFGNGLSSLSTFKSLNSCSSTATKSLGADTSTATKGDGKITTINVWVNKKTKLIDQINYVASSDIAKSSGYGGNATLTLSYSPVTVAAPTDAEPAVNALATLESDYTKYESSLSGLFGGGSSSIDSGSTFGGSSLLSN
jgi:hypothetical protein